MITSGGNRNPTKLDLGAGNLKRQRRINTACPSRPSAGRNSAAQVIVWHLLSDPETRFHDLGSDFYDNRIGPAHKKRNHIRQIEALGYKVTLEPTA